MIYGMLVVIYVQMLGKTFEASPNLGLKYRDGMAGPAAEAQCFGSSSQTSKLLVHRWLSLTR